MNRAYRLSAAVEFIHSATLLHDDVVDESEKRRGQDAANLVFGNQAAVLVGDFLFSRAFQLMVADGNLEVLRILSDASAIIAQGEVMQLSTTGNLETTLEDYEEVIKAKTAALFTAACEVGPVITGQDAVQAKAMADYGLYLGMAFQIIDDVMDYTSSNVKMGKTAGDDFREGKMTAPVIYALQNADAEEKDFWRRTLERKEQKDGDLERANAILAKHNTHAALEGTVKTLIIMPHNVIGAAPRQGHTIRGHIKQLMAERINANDIDRLMDCAHPCLTTDVGTTAYIDVFNIQ